MRDFEPCEKCGSQNVAIQWCRAFDGINLYGKQIEPRPESFIVICNRCGYSWTEPVQPEQHYDQT